MLKLGLSLNRGSSVLSKGYLSAVTAAMKATNPDFALTETQIAAVDTFITTETAAGRYSKLKRLYLPIWGNAEANRVDFISGKKIMEYRGALDHGSGYVQSVTSGYSDFREAPSSFGLTNGNINYGCLVYAARTVSNTTPIMGSISPIMCSIESTPTVIRSRLQSLSDVSYSLTLENQVGIYAVSAYTGSPNLRYFGRRLSSGFTNLGSSTAVGTASLTDYLFCMAANNGGTATTSVNSKFGAFWLGEGLSTESNVSDFTLSIKNLWESLTSLTLP